MEGVKFLIFLGSGVALLGLAFIIWMAVSKHRHYGTPNWPHVEGEIVESLVVHLKRETAHGIETTYTPWIQYRYTVDDLPYTSDTRNFLPDVNATTKDLLKATRIVTHYPVGAYVRVYYNAAHPVQSALEIPKPVAHNAVLFYGIANFVVGIGIVVLGIVLQ